MESEELNNIDLESAVAEIGNRVYKASIFFERLEGEQKIRGNGHHMAQKVAEFAKEMMRERWIDQEEK